LKAVCAVCVVARSLRSQDNHLLTKLSVYTSQMVIVPSVTQLHKSAMLYLSISTTHRQSSPLNIISKLFIFSALFNLRHVPPVTARTSNSAYRYKFCMYECMLNVCSFLMWSWERSLRTTLRCANMASQLQFRSIPYLSF